MSERLFRILGLIADDLIEEAGRSASRRRPLAESRRRSLCGAGVRRYLRLSGSLWWKSPEWRRQAVIPPAMGQVPVQASMTAGPRSCPTPVPSFL